MMQAGASVNIYMFNGGTNFGFTSGSNSIGDINAFDITSYDYFAPMDEAGDPTSKYHDFRDVIKAYLPMPNLTVPQNAPKMKLPSIKMQAKTTLFSTWSRFMLGSEMKKSNKPLSFEDLNQDNGFVLYETILPDSMPNPSHLQITKMHDEAYIYVNKVSELLISAPKTIFVAMKMNRLPHYRHLSTVCHVTIYQKQYKSMLIMVVYYKF